jgi:hypothetical protein
MNSPEEKILLKQALMEECLKTYGKLAETAKAAMLQAQESANEEKGTMGDKYESFREQCQIDRDMFARQYEENRNAVAVLQKIDISRLNSAVMAGSVVLTEEGQRFFVAAGTGKLTAGGEQYVAISTQSPLYKLLAGKKAGESFMFKGKPCRIVKVF